jgi:hypothetical protein
MPKKDLADVVGMTYRQLSKRCHLEHKMSMNHWLRRNIEGVQPKEKTKGAKKLVNWEILKKLCAIGCTRNEIANFFEISLDALQVRCAEDHGITFTEYVEVASAKGKTKLRQLQWKAAEEGNISMLMFLGKQLLGQTDRHDLAVRHEPITSIQIVNAVDVGECDD